MCANAPAAAGGLVHGPSDDGVPEPEPPRHVGAPRGISGEQLVERLKCVCLRYVRRDRSHVQLERIARHRRAVEHLLRLLTQQRKLLREHGRDLRRHLQASQQRVLAARLDGAAASRELLQIERVASALVVERVGMLTDQLARLLTRKWRQLNAREQTRAARALERRRQASW